MAKLSVVTTTTTLADMVRQVGKDKVVVHSIARYGQDPHFIEAKPSYMLKLRNADVLVSVGLDLEIGWIDLLRRGSRNPRIAMGTLGDFVAGDHFDALDVVEGRVDRSQGDVHPDGNPHFQFDPIRYLNVAEALSKRLQEVDPESKVDYQKNFEGLKSRIQSKTKTWKAEVEKMKVRNIVTYHKSLTYFFDRFNVNLVGYLEPHPGVSPTASHLARLIKKLRGAEPVCVLNETYFDKTAARRLQKDIKAHVVSVRVEVKESYEALLDQIVAAIRACNENL